MARALARFTGEAIGRKVFFVHEELVRGTPKDTTFASASWVPSVGVHGTDVVPRPDPRARAIAAAASRATQNKARAASIRQSYRLVQGEPFISARASYMVYLAAGSSPKASSGWIQRAMRRGLRRKGRTGVVLVRRTR